MIAEPITGYDIHWIYTYLYSRRSSYAIHKIHIDNKNLILLTNINKQNDNVHVAYYSKKNYNVREGRWEA